MAITERKAFLVVGGDSLVGGSLQRALRQRGHVVYASTRRHATLDSQRVYLDFESDAAFEAPPDVGYVFIVAAASNYERCETDPLARDINVVRIPKLVSALLAQGLFVSFISTNSVFGGERPWPQENAPHAPGIAYAVQKHETEQLLETAAQALQAEDRLSIVRLTKILGPHTSPLPSWFETWQRAEAVTPFADLIFAPMSVQFVGQALATLGEKRIPGQLHLSGAENVSYVDFAYALVDQLGLDPDLVKPTSATAQGVHIVFKPSYSGLGMLRTTALSDLRPQPLKAVVHDLLNPTSL